jgi:hypothetical protein
MDHDLAHLYSVFQKRAREGKEKKRGKKDRDLTFKSEDKEGTKNLYNFCFLFISSFFPTGF